MNCQNKTFWRKYIDKDSELELSERGAANEHLKECGSCRETVATLSERVELVGSALADSDGRPGAAWERFERERLTTPKAGRSFSFNTSWAAAAASFHLASAASYRFMASGYRSTA